jgi:hypothetical protein
MKIVIGSSADLVCISQYLVFDFLHLLQVNIVDPSTWGPSSISVSRFICSSAADCQCSGKSSRADMKGI